MKESFESFVKLKGFCSAYELMGRTFAVKIVDVSYFENSFSQLVSDYAGTEFEKYITATYYYSPAANDLFLQAIEYPVILDESFAWKIVSKFSIVDGTLRDSLDRLFSRVAVDLTL